jgi:aspartyl-tRNA(Asn)/glutamyl-tRNA(Gln) amidotransferase subunit C
MDVDKETLRKIAHLARLNLDDNGDDSMLKSITDIISWVEKLNEINTDNVEPLTNMASEVNVLREDVVKPHLGHEDALKNAPKKDSDYIRVPKVLE